MTPTFAKTVFAELAVRACCKQATKEGRRGAVHVRHNEDAWGRMSKLKGVGQWKSKVVEGRWARGVGLGGGGGGWGLV